MAVTSIDIISLPDGVIYSEQETVRPVQTVAWAGGTGSFDVLHEWDTVSTFDSGDLVTDNNIGVTSVDQGIPPSDLGGEQVWFYQVTITDHGDEVDEIQRILHDHTGGTFTLSFDGQGPTGAINWDDDGTTINTELELLSNITAVTVVESATGDWLVTFTDPGAQDVAMMTADGTNLTGGTTIDVTEDTKGVAAGVDTEPSTGTHEITFILSRDTPHWFFLNKNIIPGFAIGEVDDVRETPHWLYLNKNIIPAFAVGEPDDARETAAWLYLNKNINTDQPCPFLDFINISIAKQGDSIILTGDSFGATPATWGGEVRIYDTPGFGGSFITLTSPSWSDNEIVSTVSTGATSGFVTVVHTTGTPTCPGSEQKFLTVIATEADPEAGWWVQGADFKNANVTNIDAQISKAAISPSLNAVGTGSISIAANDPALPQLLDPDSDTASFIRVYSDERYRYGFYGKTLAQSVDDDGAAVVTISGEGMEDLANRAFVRPHDQPTNPTVAPTWIYGSTDNFLGNPGFDEGANELKNVDAEDGNNDSDPPSPKNWNTRGDLQTFIAVFDSALARTGDWFFKVDAANNHRGMTQSIPVSGGKVYHVRAFVKDPTAGGQRVTLALGGDKKIAAIGVTYPNNFAFGGEILAELDNVASNGLGTPGGSTDGTWQQLDVEVKTASKQTSMTITVQDDHHRSGAPHIEFWVDDITVEGWGLGLDPWKAFQSSNHASNSHVLDPVGINGSDFKYKLNGLAKFAGIEQRVSVPKNTKFVITMQGIMFDTPAVDDTFCLEILEGNGSDIIDQLCKVPTTPGVWEQWSVELPEDNQIEEVIVRAVYGGPNNPSPFYMDSFAMPPGEPPSTPGKILNDLLADIQSRGTIDWVTTSFTDDLDSKGNAWASLLSMDIDPGESLLSVLDRFVALGYEWEIVPQGFAEGGDTGCELNVYNNQSFGSGVGFNQTTGTEGPILAVGTNAVVGGRINKRVFNQNTVFTLDQSGDWTVAESGDIVQDLINYGRIEGHIQASDGDLTTLNDFAQSRIREQEDGEFGIQMTFGRDDVIRPFLDFGIGDKVFVDTVPYGGKDIKRVRSIVADFQGEGSDVIYTVHFDRVIFEDEAAVIAAIAQLQERAPAENTGLGTGRSTSSAAGFVQTNITNIVEAAPHTHALDGGEITNTSAHGDVIGALPGPLSVASLLGNPLNDVDPSGQYVLVWDDNLAAWVPVSGPWANILMLGGM